VYCGFPLAIDGFRTACEVIAEWQAAQVAQGSEVAGQG
jgi:hypothetical protein